MPHGDDGLNQDEASLEKQKADYSIDFSAEITRMAILELTELELSRAIDSITKRISQIKNERKDIEARLREQAWNHFAQTGDMQPHPAVSIKTVRHKNYLTDDNLRTAISNDLHYLLSPDPQQVEAIIETLSDSGRTDLLVLDKSKVREALKRFDSALIPEEEVTQQVWIESKLDRYVYGE